MSAKNNHNLQNLSSFQVSETNINAQENSTEFAQNFTPSNKKSSFSKSTLPILSNLEGENNTNKESIENSAKYGNKSLSKSKFEQFKAKTLAIFVGTAIMLPILALGTATYYFGSQAIDKEINLERQAGIDDLSETELARRKKLLTAWLIGTEALALIAITIAAWKAKGFIAQKSEVKTENQQQIELENLSQSDIEKTFLQDIVEEARKYLECDRVLVYSLNKDNYGTVVAESVASDYVIALGEIIQDPCFESRYLDKYRDGRIQIINNVQEAKMTSCHLAQLEKLEIKANLVTPIIDGDKLFGLLVANQCSEPRPWQKTEIGLLKQFAAKISLTFHNNKLLKDLNHFQTLATRERQWTNYFTDAVQYIRQSLQQKDILNISVEEVRRVLECDRVLVYSLNQDRYGTVVAESVLPGYTKALNKVIVDPCFEARYLEKYRSGRVRALNNIYEAALPSCYLEQLEALDVKANLVTPILNEGKIFGLLVAHQCGTSRHWQDLEIRWVTQIATQVGFALDNAKMLAKATTQQTLAEKERQWTNYFTDAVQYIRQSLQQEDILDAAVEEVKRILECDRVLVYSLNQDRYGTVLAESLTPGYTRALNKVIVDPCFEARYLQKYRDGRVRALDNIYEAPIGKCYLEQLESLDVKANLVAPIINEGKLFGLLVAHQCDAPRHWQESEIRWVTQIATQVGFALDNATLLQELQEQSISTQLLNNFIFSIRSCLNQPELLTNTVEQVTKGLKLDRTIVYQFDTNGDGTIVAESVVPGYPRSLNSQIKDPCFIKEYGEKYCQGYITAISDVHQANLSECHLEKLESLSVKASIIAPILQHDRLFGLLIGHQCTETRSWKPSEIELFAQLALYLGWALEQVKFQDNLSMEQHIQEDKLSQSPLKQNSFPKKISELQKISELLVENQSVLQKLKLKISHQSANTNSSTNQIQDTDNESVIIPFNYSEAQSTNFIDENDITIIQKPFT